MLVGFPVGFLLSLALECRADLPDAAVGGVFEISVDGACDGDERLGFGSKAVDFLFDGYDELCALGGFESVGGFYLLCVAGVIFRGKEFAIAYSRIMSVSVGSVVSLSLGKMAGGGLCRSMMVWIWLETTRMSWGL